jgi:hypothetical protein
LRFVQASRVFADLNQNLETTKGTKAHEGNLIPNALS